MATSTQYPTAHTATTGFNGTAINPTDAYTDNTVYATFVPSKPRNDEDAHSWRGFDFSGIPTGATINSVTVKVQLYVSASWAQGQWRIALFEDVTSAGALAPGVTTAIGGVQYTRATTDTSEFEFDLGTLSTEPTLAQLQATNFGVRIEAAQGNNGTSHTWYVDTIEITVDYTAVSWDKSGSGTIDAGTTGVTASGERWQRSGTGTITGGATATVATGTMQAKGTGTISHTSATVATGSAPAVEPSYVLLPWIRNNPYAAWITTPDHADLDHSGDMDLRMRFRNPAGYERDFSTDQNRSLLVDVYGGNGFDAPDADERYLMAWEADDGRSYFTWRDSGGTETVQTAPTTGWFPPLVTSSTFASRWMLTTAANTN